MKIEKVIKRILPRIGSENESVRISWTKEALKKIPVGLKILDAGAGELKFKDDCSHLKYTSQDFGQYNGVGDNKGLQTNKWDNSKPYSISRIFCHFGFYRNDLPVAFREVRLMSKKKKAKKFFSGKTEELKRKLAYSDPIISRNISI
jgi:hypothetical protein